MPIPSFIGIFRIILLLFFGVSVVSATIALSPLLFTFSPDRPGCDAPIPYRIDTFDARFPLDAKKFRKSVFEAEALWEEGIGKNLFVYDPDARLIVRTEFDDRQKMTYEAEGLETEISRYEKESAELDRKYTTLTERHRKESAALKATADAFNERLARYNSDVKKWNDSGSGTIEEYESLEKRRKKLEKEEGSLIATSEKLSGLTEDINALAGKLNKNTADINGNIKTFRERYGEPRPFVQGLYDPNIPSVTIFQFKDKDDLRLVLAHEFGHALGIEEHAESESSLMHYLMGGQDIDHPGLTGEDITAYVAACPKRIPSEREAFIRYLVFTPWEDMSAWNIIDIFMKH